MFTLRSLSIGSRRLGLGLAVAALAITTAAAPLSAAAQEYTIEDTSEIVPMAQQQGNGPTQPGNQPIVIQVKADLQVTARGKTRQGTTTKYHFLIKNNGPANAPQIVGYKEAHTHSIIGNGFQLVDNGYFDLSLNAGRRRPSPARRRLATTARRARSRIHEQHGGPGLQQ